MGASIEVVLCSGVPTQVLVFGGLTMLGLPARGADGNWHPPFVIAMSLADMALVLGLIFFFLRAHHERPEAFLFGDRPVGREFLLGLTLIPAALVVAAAVLATILAIRPELYNVPRNPFEGLLQRPVDAGLFALVVMLAGGVREEVQRAFIIRRFDRYLGGAIPGLIAFSAVFGLGHLEQGYAAAIATGVLGAGWGLLYWRRGSVVAPIVSHAGFNLAQLLNYLAAAGGRA